MRIVYLKLVNYARFPLSDIEVFEKDFTSKLFLLSGQNGSGKSSLLYELSPLPTDKTYFTNKGYKEIRIEHNNHLYTLISDHTSSSEYRFLMDSEELNMSNNVTTQKELVYRHFKINSTIHDILTGKEVFTNMSLLSRKKLFNSITHINIDSILNSYIQLKEELKNNETILKSQTSQYQLENSKLLDPAHIEQIKSTINSTKEYIDYLLSIRTELHKYIVSEQEPYQEHKSLLTKFNTVTSKYYSYITCYPYKHLPEYKIKYESALKTTDYLLSKEYSNLEELDTQLKLLDIAKSVSINELEESISTITNNIFKLTPTLSIYTDTHIHLLPIQQAVYKIESTLPELVRSIPANKLVSGKREISQSSYEELLNTKNTLLTNLAKVTAEEISITKQLQSQSNSITCPSCSTTWVPKTVSTLKDELVIIDKDRQEIENNIKTVTSSIDEHSSYLRLLKQYHELRNSTPELVLLWDSIGEYIYTDPKHILSMLSKVKEDILTIDKIQSYNKELIQLTDKLKAIHSLKSTTYQSVLDKKLEVEDTIYELSMRKDSLSETISTINRIVTMYSKIESLVGTIERSRTDIHNYNLSVVVKSIVSVIDSELSKYKVLLIEKEKELHQYTTIQYTLDQYKKTIDDTTSNIKVLTAILDELSPKNGLIAKSVSSFLNLIINGVNSTILSIWDYKMTLVPIDVDSDTLNYRFKVEVEDKLTISDISLVSRGMQEVINLSFKLVLYRLLQLPNYPLYLDELSSNMDSEHTRNTVNLVQQLITSDKFSQVFLITHKENYSHIKDIDTIEL